MPWISPSLLHTYYQYLRFYLKKVIETALHFQRGNCFDLVHSSFEQRFNSLLALTAGDEAFFPDLIPSITYVISQG